MEETCTSTVPAEVVIVHPLSVLAAPKSEPRTAGAVRCGLWQTCLLSEIPTIQGSVSSCQDEDSILWLSVDCAWTGQNVSGTEAMSCD